MAVGFDAAGERYARRLPANLTAVASGCEGAVAALAATVDLRRAGTPFCVAPLVEEPLARQALETSGSLLEALPDLDDRYEAFDALARDLPADPTSADPAQAARRRVLRDVALMGDVLLVRSQREAERVERLLGRRRPHVVVAPGVDPDVPAPRPERGAAIVVWAPHLDAQQLGVIAMGLDSVQRPRVYVCASGALAGVPGTFVDPTRGAWALARAACIIDASIDDPAGALALARWERPLLVASTSGASEFLDGALTYDPWDWRTVFAAAAAAPGAQAPIRTRDAFPSGRLAAALERSQPTAAANAPLVSVVVLTYNRRELLALALASVARQTYPHLELIVVNNGGTDVGDLVALYANARIIDLPTNLLPNAALERGLDACRGAYFGVLSDDDEFFPSHIAGLVAALERSGAHVAHADTLTRYLSVAGGRRETVAFRVRHDRPSDRLQILVGSTMTIHSMLFRAEVRERIGGLEVELAPADLEYTIRAAQQFDFVHVDRVTCEWNYIVEGTSYTHRDDMYEGLEHIYRTYPSNGSRIVERRRAAELDRFGERHAGKPLWPADLLLTGERPRS